MTDFHSRSELLRQRRAEGLAGLSYEIAINEVQRAALADILKQFFNEHPDHPAQHTVLEYWDQMLADLPATEEETPGVLHGFCL